MAKPRKAVPHADDTICAARMPHATYHCTRNVHSATSWHVHDYVFAGTEYQFSWRPARTVTEPQPAPVLADVSAMTDDEVDQYLRDHGIITDE